MTENASKDLKHPPDQEHEADFPPLPKRARPQALAVRPTSINMSKNVKGPKHSVQGTDTKTTVGQELSSSSPVLLNSTDSLGMHQTLSPNRKMGAMKRPKQDESWRGNATVNVLPNVSNEYQAISPMKRSKMMCYRDPPLLKSLDSETFGSLTPQSLGGDSFLSTPAISPNISTPVYANNNLGSLTDVIQKYSGTSLNSLPIDIDSPSHEAPGLSSSSHIISPLASSTPNTKATQRAEANSPQPTMCTTPHSNAVGTNTSDEAQVQKTQPNTETVLTSSSSTSTVSNVKNSQKPKDLKPSSNSKQISETPVRSVRDSKNGETHVCNCVPSRSMSTLNGEIYEGGLDIKNRACKKNPGHQSFHLPSELKVKDLPPDIQHEDSVTFFNCLSQLVVRITVERTSDKRPPDDMYKDYIGTNSRRNGSGFIASVDDRIIKRKCRREDCNGTDDPDANLNRSSLLEDSVGLKSPPPVDRSLSNMSTASSSSSNSSSDGPGSHCFYGGVYINTNKHVIFDKSEADFAHVHFFFNTPDKKGVIHGHVASIAAVSPNQDRVVLHVMSHDRSLFNLINLHLKNARSSYTQMLRSTHTSQLVHGYGKKHSWAVIISHPHGLAKSITCGRVIDEVEEARCVVKYYDAATCPGSSGGLVTTPSLLQLQWPGAVHSCSDAATGLNVTFDSRFPDLDNKLISRIHKPLLGRKDSLPDNIFSL